MDGLHFRVCRTSAGGEGAGTAGCREGSSRARHSGHAVSMAYRAMQTVNKTFTAMALTCEQGQVEHWTRRHRLSRLAGSQAASYMTAMRRTASEEAGPTRAHETATAHSVFCKRHSFAACAAGFGGCVYFYHAQNELCACSETGCCRQAWQPPSPREALTSRRCHSELISFDSRLHDGTHNQRTCSRTSCCRQPRQSPWPQGR